MTLDTMANDPQQLAVSQTFLAHAILAHISPEVTTLDHIIGLQSRGALRVDAPTTSIAAVPPEILLLVRSYLLPSLTDTLMSQTLLAYTDSLLSRARRLCAECLKYNVQVFGPDALTWPSSRPGLSEDAQGCECGTWVLRAELCVAEPATWAKMTVSTIADTFEPKFGGPRGHKRTHSYSTASVSWLEEYLAKRAGRGKSIRDVIAAVLANDFACVIPTGVAGVQQPSSSHPDVPDAIAIMAPPSCTPPSAEDRLKILSRELALSTTATVGSELLTTARDMAASIIAATVASAPCADASLQSAPAKERAAGPSIFTLVSAGLALGAYALARFTQ